MAKRKNANDQLDAWMKGISKLEIKRKGLTEEDVLRIELHEELDKLDGKVIYAIAESIGLR